MRSILPKLSAGAFLLFSLCGCGNYYAVGIPYRLPDKSSAGVKSALSALYVTVKAQPEPEENIVGSLLKQQNTALNAYALGGKIAKALSAPGAGVRAYRVSRVKESADPYARYFAPSGLLEIKVSDPQVSLGKEERTSSYTDKDKQQQTVKTTVWKYSASIKTDIKLVSFPDGGTLDKADRTFVIVEERRDDSTGAPDWYREHEEVLFDDAASWLAGRYVGRPVQRSRPMFTVKDDKGSSRAVDLALREKWPQAEALWSERLKAGGGWRDLLGLGVAAEVRGDFATARAYYSKARDAAAGDKGARAVRWKEIFSDLDLMLSTGAASAAPARDWFAVPSAVLPFSDETTSIDGPPLVRTLFYEALKAGGYRVQAPEETDRLLLAHGFTQGGQLGAADPAQLCEWLGVERVFYGNISAFGEIMAGLYNKRTIQGRLSLWDLQEGNFIWSAEPSVVKVNTPKSMIGGLLSQLARGLGERLKNKPLAYEASLFTNGAAEALPNYPAR